MYMLKFRVQAICRSYCFDCCPHQFGAVYLARTKTRKVYPGLLDHELTQDMTHVFTEACHVLGSDGTVKNTVFWGRYALKVYAVRFSEMWGKFI